MYHDMQRISRVWARVGKTAALVLVAAALVPVVAHGGCLWAFLAFSGASAALGSALNLWRAE